jgi:LuxR family quorum-sensing system transcriptional regulator SolR
MGDWCTSMIRVGVHALVVLGPDLYASTPSHVVLAVHPLDTQAEAYALVNSRGFGEGGARAGEPPIAWQCLATPDPHGLDPQELLWRSQWRARGSRGVVRVSFGLPAGRSFECFLFTDRVLEHRDQAETLAWSALGMWPTLKSALVTAYSPLTPRERQCLVLAFDGLTARASAERMACTERTVNFHLANAMAKLKAENKITAIQRACWLGVI